MKYNWLMINHWTKDYEFYLFRILIQIEKKKVLIVRTLVPVQGFRFNCVHVLILTFRLAHSMNYKTIY